MKRGLAPIAAAALFVVQGLIARADQYFPPVTTVDPVAQSSGSIAASARTAQFVQTLDSSNQVFYFTYVSDGKSAVRFDTLGSNFSTPSGGQTLGSSNISQIAVYDSSGNNVTLSKGTQDTSGNPIALFPYYTPRDNYKLGLATYPNGTLWYAVEELSQLSLTPNAPSNPHAAVSPADPTPYVGWSAGGTPLHPLGNPGNSQVYSPPSYVVPLNEYQVWNTSLSTVVLNGQGQPVDANGNVVADPANAKPQPGWRYYDRTRVGPGETYNRGNVLPAGTYYIAVATSTPLLAGDISGEEVAQAPIHYYYDPNTFTTYVNAPILGSNMTGFQYLATPDSTGYTGTINFNVTKGTVLTWNNAGGTGNGSTWDVSSSQNFNSSGSPINYTPGDYITFDDTNNGHYNVTLNSTVSPFSVDAFNSSGNYVLSGTGGIAGTGNFNKYGTGTFTLGTSNSYSGETIVNAGTLNITGTVAGYAITVKPGASLILGPHSVYANIPEYARDATVPGYVSPNLIANGQVSITAATAGSGFNLESVNVLSVNNGVTVSLATSATLHTDRTVLSAVQISLAPTGKLNLGGNDLIIHGGNTLEAVAALIKSGMNSGTWTGSGLNSLAAATDPLHLTALGVVSNSSGFITTFDGQTVATTDVIVKYTYYGDANLDGVINGSDYSLIDNGFNRGLTGWLNGDSNYDGVVDGSDYSLIDNAFNSTYQQAHPLTQAMAAVESAEVSAAVPEPTTLCLGALASAAILIRRRRR